MHSTLHSPQDGDKPSGKTPSPIGSPIGSPSRDFLWGVATSAYQHEGGFNGEGEPQNNWAWAEHKHRVDPTGKAADFWHLAEEDFARCHALGLNAFRLSLAWERIQPSTQLNPNGQPSPNAPPPFDEAALARYGALLADCRKQGLEPMVTLHHFTHPAWLGVDAWLDPGTIDHYLRYVEKTVVYFLEALPRDHGTDPPRWFLTINEPNLLSISSYLNGIFPSGARTPKSLHQTLKCQTHLMEAHVKAYRLIHQLYADHGRTGHWAPMVSFNNYCSDLYWADQAWLDLLFAPSRGIQRGQLFNYLWKQARSIDQAFRRSTLPIRPRLRYWSGQILKKLHHLAALTHSLEKSWVRLLDVLYSESGESHPPLDYIAFDYYDPFIAHVLRWPRGHDLFHKHRQLPMPIRPPFHERFLDSITNKWWDWKLLPEGLAYFVHISERFDLPIVIAENGMANRSDPHRHHGRHDKLLRSDFLHRHLAVVKSLKSEGVRLIGYFHWSLVDNYEWGSYAPRFGLFNREREPVDFRGDNASATYAREIAEE